MNKLVKVVSLAACLFLLLTAEGCPAKDPGKAGPGVHKAILNGDGEYNVGVQRSRMDFKASNPKPGCTWTLMYDLPRGKVVVVKQGGAKAAQSGVDFGVRKLRYKDPRTGKIVRKEDHPTSFYTENCGAWVQK